MPTSFPTAETCEVFIDMGDLPAQFEVKLIPLPAVLWRMFGRQPEAVARY